MQTLETETDASGITSEKQLVERLVAWSRPYDVQPDECASERDTSVGAQKFASILERKVGSPSPLPSEILPPV